MPTIIFNAKLFLSYAGHASDMRRTCAGHAPDMSDVKIQIKSEITSDVAEQNAQTVSVMAGSLEQ